MNWYEEKNKVLKLKFKDTNSNQLKMIRNKENYKKKFFVEEAPLFKMKRFQGVESKIPGSKNG